MSRKNYHTIQVKIVVISIMSVISLLFNTHALRAVEKNAIYYNKHGWDYIKRGDNRKAIFSFKNALNKNAHYKEALIGLGKAYYNIEAYNEAYELYMQALRIQADSREALVGLGFTFVGLGQYNRALATFSKVQQIIPEDLESRYGVAYLYHVMGKNVWSKRKLQTILQINPFHYKSLLLMAHMKSVEKRFSEAKDLVQKAIDSDNTNPVGFIAYGEILLKKYLMTEDKDVLKEALHSLQNALSIQPENFNANRIMGFISLYEKDYDKAVEYYTKSYAEARNGSILYSLAISHDLKGDKDNSLKTFLEGLKHYSSDSIMRTRMEEFLLFNEYKIGHPARIMLNRDHYGMALRKEKNKLPDEAMLHFRRALLLNPMDISSRLHLMAYYKVLEYDRFYIQELKDLHKIDNTYRDQLRVAIYQRRTKLYGREGYTVEEPPRNIPTIAVLNFSSSGKINAHPDAGEVLAESLTFVLGQYGRMQPIGIRKRHDLVKGLQTEGDYLAKSLDQLEQRAGQRVDFIVYGAYTETGTSVTLNCKLLDNKKGFIINEFTLSESGKESVLQLALRGAKRIYASIPFQGQVLKLKERGIIVNLGLFDGIEPGKKLIVFKFDNTKEDYNRRKLVFAVKEADTLICYAEALNQHDLALIDSSDIVYPYKQRRAVLIK